VRSSTLQPQTVYSHHLDAEFRVAASGMAWRGADSEEVIAMAAQDIKWSQWIRVARGFQLRVGMKDRRREKFDGFLREVC
jgi:structure-specific recognition protein 1